ncbi:MAG: VOC family protein [Planctomycetia bacterium]|jgi:catechol 2,3-dioxygenase-like lactoylglutathione lyase family enzyme
MAADIPERPSLYAVELRTARWPDMVAWYRDVLGLRMLVRSAEEGFALLAAGETRLAVLARPQAAGSSDRWSLAFEVTDLDEARTRLAAGSADLGETRTHDEGYRELTVADPDGNRIRLFSWPTR